MDGKEKLLERKHKLIQDKKEIDEELIYIEIELDKFNDAPLEVCLKCDHCYTISSLSSLMFDNFRNETTDSSEELMHCTMCNRKLKRLPSFSETLKLVKDDNFLTDMLNENSEYLSEKSLVILSNLVQHLSVPSFVTKIERNKNVYSELEELMEKDYVRIIDGQHLDYLILIFNAIKLKLHNHEELLAMMSTQKEFNSPYIVNKRAARLKKLPNNFTEKDKEALLQKFNNRCAFTGKEVNLHMDHVIPVSWEIEGTTVSNMLPICGNLNSSKHDSNVFEWYKKNGEKYEVKEHLFIDALIYIAELNDMTLDEYESYVYECEENKK